MELRIAIFLAVVLASLALNAVMMVYLYHVLSRVEARLEAARGPMDTVFGAIRKAVEKLAEASTLAADWSGRIRDQVEDLEPKVLGASSQVGYTLAKIDFEVDRFRATARDRLRSVTKRTKEKAAGPLTEVIAIIQGARALGHLVSLVAEHGEKAPEDEDSTPFRRQVL